MHRARALSPERRREIAAMGPEAREKKKRIRKEWLRYYANESERLAQRNNAAGGKIPDNTYTGTRHML